MANKVYVLMALQEIVSEEFEQAWCIVGIFSLLENAEKLKNQLIQTSLAVEYDIKEYELM